MPKVYRTMLPDESGEKPKIGSTTDEPGLGARVAPDRIPDIHPNSAGQVIPGMGGMSVSPSVKDMPGRLIPERWKERYRHARGDDNCVVWCMGEGPFATGPIDQSLQLRLDKKTHGLVEPRTSVTVDEFQNLLAGTQSQWQKEEL